MEIWNSGNRGRRVGGRVATLVRASSWAWRAEGAGVYEGADHGAGDPCHAEPKRSRASLRKERGGVAAFVRAPRMRAKPRVDALTRIATPEGCSKALVACGAAEGG